MKKLKGVKYMKESKKKPTYKVTIVNPEAIPNACINYTSIARQLYDKGAFKFQKAMNVSKNEMVSDDNRKSKS